MKVGELVFVKHPHYHGIAIVIKKQVYSDSYVLMADPLNFYQKDRRTYWTRYEDVTSIELHKQYVFDLKEADHYAKPFGTILDLSQRFETKEAKEEWQHHRIQSLQKLKVLHLRSRPWNTEVDGYQDESMTIGDWIKDILLLLVGIVLYVGLPVLFFVILAAFYVGPWLLMDWLFMGT